MIAQPDQRQTTQELAPHLCVASASGDYCLYPSFATPSDSITAEFADIAETLRGCTAVRIDGYIGVDWSALRAGLQGAFDALGIETAWLDVATTHKREHDAAALVGPFLGGDDPLFGTRADLDLRDFLATDQLRDMQRSETADCTIAYGCGAALLPWDGPLVYVDLPKNELQFRSRAGAVTNLGTQRGGHAKAQYKRFYFVDWPVLNRHKSEIVDRIDWFIDGQRSERPTMIRGNTLRSALAEMSRNAFRVRPWFEPGPWGGQWIKQNIPALPVDVPNYAWSFELITPENGIMFSDGTHLLEVSFDWLMYQEHQAVLGDCAERFGCEFPIRFDFLDTFDGGNLSIQCHPRHDYIRQEFGESFTQDETYYILDCEPGANVYLGFVDGIQPVEFRAALERSAAEGAELDVARFVNSEPSRKHNLYLIPNGTIHASGTDNLVLEISATPYIFTFKMYDWLRMDLDGQPRPLNIDRAFENLDFQRQGDRVAEELISEPVVIEEGADWRLIHLPTHAEHFYDVERYEFETSVHGHTSGSAQVMMLVEGSSLLVKTNDEQQSFHFAETFVIPAAAGAFKLTNQGETPAMVVKAFVKPDQFETDHSPKRGSS